MPSFGRRTDGLSGRRRQTRQPVLLAASALSIERSRSAIVSDLSAAGAKLNGRDLPKPGSEVLIGIGSEDSFATIKWWSEEACGVEFDRLLAPQQIDNFKTEGAWESVTGATR